MINFDLPAVSGVSHGHCFPIHGQSYPTRRGQVKSVALPLFLVVQPNVGDKCSICFKNLQYLL